MSEQPPSAIGTVAQEAARLIEDMATLARSGSQPGDRRSDGRTDGSSNDPGRYAGGPGGQRPTPGAPRAARSKDGAGASDGPSSGVCSECGAQRGETTQTPATCRLCPLCRGIALLRAVRPETVDLLADLAVALAASLRDVATRSRAADPSAARPTSGAPSDGDRATVQDIPVNDDSEGWTQ